MKKALVLLVALALTGMAPLGASETHPRADECPAGAGDTEAVVGDGDGCWTLDLTDVDGNVYYLHFDSDQVWKESNGCSGLQTAVLAKDAHAICPDADTLMLS